MPSISRRIGRSYFLLSLGMIAVMVAIVLYVNENLEQTMLERSFVEERDFFLKQQELSDRQDPLRLESSTLIAFFLPLQAARHGNPPDVFSGLADGFFGEIERDGQTYLAAVNRTTAGRFYFARDITRHERQEVLFMIILTGAGLGILGLSFVLSVFASRRLTIPLRRLAEQIRATVPGQSMRRLSESHSDSELVAIAATFNHFLKELEAFVEREQSLLGLASHELRTPVAVVSGALDIVEKRNQLQDNDRVTLQRIRNAINEMEENVKVLLDLSRHSESKERQRTDAVLLRPLIKDIEQELAFHGDSLQRLQIDVPGELRVAADPVLTKMLFRNLIKNAIEHTTRQVWVHSFEHGIEILDAGPGLPEEQREFLANGNQGAPELSELTGLGLYIATLVSERLGWQLRVKRSGRNGTVIQVVF